MEEAAMPWMWGPGFTIGLFWLLVWLALIALVVWTFARGWQSRSQPIWPPRPGMHPPQEEPSAMEVLRRRYARGEIDTATFEAMRERLEASMEREQPPIPST
jgi:putative membrane protein